MNITYLRALVNEILLFDRIVRTMKMNWTACFESVQGINSNVVMANAYRAFGFVMVSDTNIFGNNK